jgi:hypothetical protein
MTIEHRWVSRGGVQITGHQYVEHTEAVLRAWWLREAERTYQREVTRATVPVKPRRLEVA